MIPKSRVHWLKAGLLAIGAADCVGIFLVHRHLAQPVDDQPFDEAFVMATATTSGPVVNSKALDEGPMLAVVPAAHERRVKSPAAEARGKLPLPDYDVALRTTDGHSRAARWRDRSPASLSHLVAPKARPVQLDLPLDPLVAAGGSFRSAAGTTDQPPGLDGVSATTAPDASRDRAGGDGGSASAAVSGLDDHMAMVLATGRDRWFGSRVPDRREEYR